MLLLRHHRSEYYPRPNASVAANQFSICDGQSVQLNANPGWRYKWLPAEGLSNDTIADPVASPTPEHYIRGKVYNEVITCCDTAQVKIVVWSKPKVNAGRISSTTNDRFSWKVLRQARVSVIYGRHLPGSTTRRTLHPRAIAPDRRLPTP